MTDVNIDAIFPTLEAQAARLNAASARVNQSLASAEKRIAQLNIGFEVWLEEPIFVGQPEPGSGRYETSTTPISILGLARVDGNWVLAIKSMRYVDGFFEGDTSQPYRNQYAEGDAFALLPASRGLRIAALQALPKFLQKLIQEVTSTTQEIEASISRLAPERPPK
jgi:hypothetical protein